MVHTELHHLVAVVKTTCTIFRDGGVKSCLLSVAYHLLLVGSGTPITFPHFTLTLDEGTGGVSSLIDAEGNQWAGQAENLFEFLYMSSNQTDFDLFNVEIKGTNQCYSKHGMQNETCAAPMGCAKSQVWSGRVAEALGTYGKTATGE